MSKENFVEYIKNYIKEIIEHMRTRKFISYLVIIFVSSQLLQRVGQGNKILTLVILLLFSIVCFCLVFEIILNSFTLKENVLSEEKSKKFLNFQKKVNCKFGIYVWRHLR